MQDLAHQADLIGGVPERAILQRRHVLRIGQARMRPGQDQQRGKPEIARPILRRLDQQRGPLGVARVQALHDEAALGPLDRVTRGQTA